VQTTSDKAAAVNLSDCRALAANAVAAVAGRGQSLGGQLALAERSVKPRDRALLRELCYGTLRWHPQLAALIKPLLAKPFKAKDSDVLALLLVGAYQLLHTRIPDHAALAATVEAARAMGKGWATGLINGVLRNLQRQASALLEKLDPAAAAAHPEWLWQRLHRDWPAQAASIATANNGHPPMCLRVNAGHTDIATYLAQLAEQGIAATRCIAASGGIRLNTPCDVESLPGFGDGVVSVQDEAAQLAAPLLAVEPGQRVLDACCAPGGKTGHILESQPQLGELWALDSSADRLRRVEENLRRLGGAARLIAGDARATADWWDGVPFDRILLDAPCSGSGVIRRHPDIKLLRTAADISQLAALQRQLLDALWPLLAIGGVLVYATCSVLPEENSDVIAAFIGATPTAEAWSIDADWGLPQAVGRQLLPAIDGSDGFFYARLRKIG
jgi:16S rRNA (cytosine967-C5)-methyltransferase